MQEPQIDPGRIGKQHQDKGQLGQNRDLVRGNVHIEQVKRRRADQHAQRGKHDRRRQADPVQMPRHQAVTQYGQRDQEQGRRFHSRRLARGMNGVFLLPVWRMKGARQR